MHSLLQSGKQSKMALLRQRVNLAALVTCSHDEILNTVEKDKLLSVVTKLLTTLEPAYLDR